ncbi:MAG: transcription-repair coupling factor, partial [Caldanaerobacter sp.]
MFTVQIEELKEVKAIEEELKQGRGPVLIYGLVDSQKAHIAHYLMKKFNKIVLVVTPDDVEARRIYEDLYSFNEGKAYLFPKRDVVFYKVAAASHEIVFERLKVIKGLCEETPLAVVASIDALLDKLIPFNLFKKYQFRIKVGDKIELEDFSRKLQVMGYERVQTVEGKGQFSVRGGIIDIFPSTEEYPFRIELFDDEVDSLRVFDVMSQRSLNVVEEVFIFPATEFIVEEEHIKRGISTLSRDLNDYLSKIRKTKSGMAEKLKEKFDEIMEEISEGRKRESIKVLINYFYENPASLRDYVGNEAIVILDETSRIKQRISNLELEFNENFKNLLERGEVIPEQKDIFFDYNKIVTDLKSNFLVIMNTLAKPEAEFHPQRIVNFVSRSMHSFHGKMDLLVEDLKYYKSAGYKVLLLSGNKERAKILKDALQDYGIDSAVVEDKEYDIQKGQVVIYPASVTKGFEYVDARFAVI